MYYISSDHLQLRESVLMRHAQKVISAKSQYSYLELTWCLLDKGKKWRFFGQRKQTHPDQYNVKQTACVEMSELLKVMIILPRY